MRIARVPPCAAARGGRRISQLHARPRPNDWRRWLNYAGLSAVPVRDDRTFESVGLAVEAAAGLGYAIAIEGYLVRSCNVAIWCAPAR